MSDSGSESNEHRVGFLRRAARGASERVIDVIDPDTILSHVDINALLERIDINELLARADVDALVDRIDLNGLLDRIDVKALLERIDLNAVLAQVDVDALIDRIDVNRLVDQVDVAQLLAKIDVADVVDRIDVDGLVQRVDIPGVLDRIDVDEVLAKVDIDAVIDRIDVPAVVQRAGIPEIVAESTSHLTSSALDLFRRPVVGIDEIVFRGVNRLVRRDPTEFPPGPGPLVHWADEHGENDEGLRTGRYAGPVTRLLAVVIDVLLLTTGFTLGVAGVGFLLTLITGGRIELAESGWVYGALFVVTALFYMWLCIAVFGKTAGKAVMGSRVVSADGSLVLHNRQPVVRALVFPVSVLLFGIGLLGILFGRERRAWHDNSAGTAVVYDWGTRVARMPSPLAAWLERRGEERAASAEDGG